MQRPGELSSSFDLWASYVPMRRTALKRQRMDLSRSRNIMAIGALQMAVIMQRCGDDGFEWSGGR